MIDRTRRGKELVLTARFTVFILSLILVGCGSTSSPSADMDADILYHWGDTQETLEERYGKGLVVWVADIVPDDEFAAATVRTMISIGKPRPRSYEVFLRRNDGAGGQYFRDYVFYSAENRVIYFARRSPLQPSAR
jgi:hypothetical protein